MSGYRFKTLVQFGLGDSGSRRWTPCTPSIHTSAKCRAAIFLHLLSLVTPLWLRVQSRSRRRSTRVASIAIFCQAVLVLVKRCLTGCPWRGCNSQGERVLLTLWIKGLEHLEKWSKLSPPRGGPLKSSMIWVLVDPPVVADPVAQVNKKTNNLEMKPEIHYQNA